MFKIRLSPLMIAVVVLSAVFGPGALAVRPVYAATRTVTNHNDAGPGSLRQAIAEASPGDTIVFAPSLSFATIMLTGGQLWIDKDLTIDGSRLADPITINGGENGRVFYIDTDKTVLLDSLRITGGKHNQGAGIYNWGILTVKNCFIYENAAPQDPGVGYQDGAGISNFGTLNLIGSTVSDNSLQVTHNRLGGGVFNAGTLTVTNSTISANTAFLGGGVYNHDKATIINSTIVGSSWQGIYNSTDGTLHYANTIVAHGLTGCKNDGTIGMNVHNLVINNDGCGTPHITQDPLLGSLDFNGGWTKTHALQAGSPAIDAGSNAHCPPTDQRGAFRPFDGNEDGSEVCDIGAYEYGSYIRYYTFLPLIQQ